MQKIDELVELTSRMDGYALGLTTLKDGKLEHFFITEKFHDADVLRSIAKIKGLAIEHLERGDDNVKDTK